MSRTSATLLTILFSVATASAEVSTDQPGALLIFPKVVVDNDRDTLVQISNASGGPVAARCFYTNPQIDTDSGELVWLTVDFRIVLTRLQPTLWLASEGRAVTPTDRPEALEPGPVPPVSPGFVGELRCIVVGDEEQPITRNALTGDATILNRATGEALRYQAVSVNALPRNNNDGTLLLNNVEYSACPRMLLLNHLFDDALDPVLQTPVKTNLTVVPCSIDYERSIPGTASLQFDVVNEFEQRLSASLPVVCFADLPLTEIDSDDPTRSIFNVAIQGTLAGQTRIRPVPDGDTAHGHGVVAIAEQFHAAPSGGTALNLHFISGNLQGDVVVLPRLF